MLSLADISQARRLVVLDCETTGHNVPNRKQVAMMPRSARLSGIIIEVGCIELIRHDDSGDWNAGRTWSTLVNPESALSVRSKGVHNIHPYSLAKAPRFHDIQDEMSLFFGDSLLVAHSAHSELSYLNHEYRRCGISTWDEPAFKEHRFLDTQLLCAQAMPDCGRSLDAVCDRLWIDRSLRFAGHAALLDAVLTSEVFIKLTSGFIYQETRSMSW